MEKDIEITTEQAAIALDVSQSTIIRYAKILNIKKKQRCNVFMLALQKDDLMKIAKTIDSLYSNTKEQDLARKYISELKSGKTLLSVMQQEHPLVKNPKMFITGWFPPIDSYEFLPECNTVRVNSGS